VTLRITSAIGAPFGMWAALWGMMIPQRAGAQLLVWACVAGVVVGAGAAATGSAFLRYTRGRWASVVGLVLAQLGVTATLAVIVLYAMSQWPARGQWKALPAAPERVVRFEGPDCVYDIYPVVAARTTTGRLFRLNPTGPSRQWEADDGTARDPHGTFRDCSVHQRGSAPTQPEYPRPPGRPVQVHRVELHGADCGGSAAYALDQDGAMWEWGIYGCALGALFLLLGTGGMVFILSVAASSLTVFSSEGRNWRSGK